MKDGWEVFNPTLSQSRLGSHGDNEGGEGVEIILIVRVIAGALSASLP